jgi:hypothetical protein
VVTGDTEQREPQLESSQAGGARKRLGAETAKVPEDKSPQVAGNWTDWGAPARPTDHPNVIPTWEVGGEEPEASLLVFYS